MIFLTAASMKIEIKSYSQDVLSGSRIGSVDPTTGI